MATRTRDFDSTRAGFLLACLALAACAPAAKPTENAGGADSPGAPGRAAPASSPADAAPPAEPVEPLETPERVASGEVSEAGGTWNPAVREVTYPSAADGSTEPMMFYAPETPEPRPLLVGLHSWSEDYRQAESAIYAEWCVANDWVFVHPSFRGPNIRPEATGSDLVIGDVLGAIEYARKNARVDESRIYAVGWSGGGFLGLLLAGRHPGIWAGVSAWVPISDLNAWYEESRRLGTGYVSEIAASCGGAPIGSTAAAEECRKRSPLAHLENARAVAIDINHGIRDGRSEGDPVPIGQSLRAFNALAEPADRFTDAEIASFTREAAVPPHLRGQGPFPSEGGLEVLYRRESGNARLTVFDGAHEKNTEAALAWLNRQRRR